MIARAPGKLVLSGAYAVLEGAPALVAAVDRYVVADSSRAAERLTPEVREALGRRGPGREHRAPWFDATELRDESQNRKLGLGSSAAILVASLAALELDAEPDLPEADLAMRVFSEARAAHRAAQGGGSGIDVAASAFGGVHRFELPAPDTAPIIATMTLPQPLFISMWSSSASASTPDMLARVAALALARPKDHARAMSGLSESARAAALATDGARFVEACREQVARLAELGDLAGAPIVTAEAHAFGRAVSTHGVVMPSGAGGGDLVLYLGTGEPYEGIADAARRSGFAPLAVSLGARGVHAAPRPWQVFERNAAVP
jgi:phosphomevalonate kinase